MIEQSSIALEAIQTARQGALAAPSKSNNYAQAQKAGAEFESQFISQLVGAMFEGVETDGPFGGGNGEQMMRSFMIDEYAKQISDRGGFGIAERVTRELLSYQEAAGESR